MKTQTKSKVMKHTAKAKKEVGEEEMMNDVETSDDDFIDPSIEKYFKNKKEKSKTKNGMAKKGNEASESDSESDYEEQAEEEEEEEESEAAQSESEEEEEGENGLEGEQMDMDDDEAADKDENREKVTLSAIKSWSTSLAKEKPYQTIHKVVQAFKAALLNVIPNRKASITKYKVEGPELFNAMVRLCMRDLFPCFLRLLNLNKASVGDSLTSADGHRVKLASSGENWKKLKAPIRSYLDDMLILAQSVHDAEILNAVLRHMRLLINFYLCFPKMLKNLIKFLIATWSQKDEKSRVIAFVCLHKIVANTHEKNQSFLFKSLYLAFARNSKFTSINTLPLINFMQRSLIEIYSFNNKLAYEHVFVYIRQLAIHLRNAMNLKKKESYQAVYNWQYVHSLILWSKLLSTLVKTKTGTNEYLQPLVYPVTQCLIGTIKLVPTPRYYPLRFHCINALINLSNSTDIYIPIIPFVLEVFDITDFNKNHQTISVKNINFSFLLKLNKQQMHDKAFKDTLIDVIYENLILLLQHQSHDISFPELVLPLNIRLKDFTKKCKNANYCKVIKGLLDKVQENVKFIDEKRNKATFSLKDKKAIDHWMEKNKETGTPLSQWYARYRIVRERELLLEASNKEHIVKDQLAKKDKPEKPVIDEKKKAEDKKEFAELFMNLSEEEDSEVDDLLDFVPKKTSKNGLKQEIDADQVESEDDFEDVISNKKKNEQDIEDDEGDEENY